MTTAVDSAGTVNPSSRTGPPPPNNSQNQRGGHMSQGMRGTGNGPQRRNVGSPANDGPQNQRRGSRPWNNHPGGNNQYPNARGGAYSNNNGRRSPATDPDASDRHLYDRLLYLLIRAVGSSVVATVRTGARYSGILSAAHTQGDVGVVVRFARKIAAPPGEELDDKAKDAVISTLVIQPKDLLDIKIMEVNITESQSTFRTDTDISARGGEIKQRELQPWTPDESIPLGESLDDLSNKSGGWDQFAVNEKLFGVQSTFDELLYTTKVDKSHPQYQERLAEAERIAREIESQSHNGNVHLAEERGVAIDDSGADEEDKYSGVVRDKAQLSNLQSDSNKYTPPALRQKSMAEALKSDPKPSPQEPAKETQPAPQQTSTPAPVDAAIISSKITSQSSGSVPKAASTLASIKPFIPASRKAAAAEAIAGLIRKDPAPPKEKPSIETNTSATVAAAPKSATIADDAKAANSSDSKVAAVPKFDNQQLVGVFKDFVHGEKERSTQKKHQRIQEGKISDLRAFSESFKLYTPVPPDLIPILAKDKAKQEEIINRSVENSKQPDAKRPLSSAAMAQTGSDAGVATPKGSSPAPPLSARLAATQKQKEEAPTSQNKKEEPKPASPALPPPSSAAPKTSPSLASTKLNVNAHEFKPNPFASSFTPSFAARAPSTSPSIASASASGTPRMANKAMQPPQQESSTFFSAQWKPPANRASVLADFNPFLTLKNEYKGSEPFVLPRAYMSAPTWVLDDTKEISHIEMFTQPDPVSSARVIGIPPPAPAAFSPRGVPTLPSGHASPSVSGPGSPFVPPPPIFDEPGRAAVFAGASPPITSPSVAAQQMMHGPGFVPPVMYGQQPPFFYRPGPGPNGAMPPGFMGNGPPPSQQFMQHQGYPYMGSPQMAPAGYGSPGRNSHQAAMMMPNGSQQGNFNGGNGGMYQQPPMHMMRGPPMSMPQGGPQMMVHPMAGNMPAPPPPQPNAHRQYNYPDQGPQPPHVQAPVPQAPVQTE